MATDGRGTLDLTSRWTVPSERRGLHLSATCVTDPEGTAALISKRLETWVETFVLGVRVCVIRQTPGPCPSPQLLGVVNTVG